MITPEYLEYQLNLLQTHKHLQESILKDIVRRMLKTDMTVTDTAAWQIEKAQQAGMLYRDIVYEVSRRTNEVEYEIKALFRDAEVEVFNYDDELILSAGYEPQAIKNISPAMRKAIEAALRKTSTEAINLTKTTANTAQSLYIAACDLAHQQVLSGAFPYQTAIANGIKYTAKQGVTVVYPSGWISSLDTAIRRSVLTGVNQTAGKLQDMRANELDVDIMELTAHSGARLEHSYWQGELVSRSGQSGYLSLSDIGYGDVKGFMGANCRHNWHMFFHGISVRAYTPKMLDEFNNRTVVYNNTEYPEYKAREIQRSFERDIRKTKQELVCLDTAIKEGGADLQTDFNAAAVKLKRQEERLRDFAVQTGFRIDTFRTQVFAVETEKGIANFGKSVSQKAVWANKKAVQKFADQHIASINARKALQSTASGDIIDIYRFSKREDADKLLRPLTESLWNKLSAIEKQSAYEYTISSERFNRPLRGYNGDWNAFVGIGKIPLNNEGAEQFINGLTTAINKTDIPYDIWLFRGSDQQSLAGLLGVDKSKVIPSNIKALNRKFAGKDIWDDAFFSTGIAADAGFRGQISYEILVPKGTKGIYAEPFSYYGGTNTYGTWDGKQKASFVGGEAEIVLQKGTRFVVQEINEIAGKVNVVLQVVE